ncbi:MAG: DNA repair protein RecO [Candidatus Magasanikbacteria bacterium]|nr:DNA repair protein RecO [Candidatus Magasanikbacteria bacterium]
MLAIVLSRRNFREYDQVVSLYTAESGKREVLARGIKKIIAKNAGALEPASLSAVEIVPGREIDYLATAQPLALFPGLRSDLIKSWQAQRAIHLIDRLTHVGEKQPALFKLLEEWLIALERASKPEATGILALVWRLLDQLGFRPDLTGAAASKTTATIFSVSQGGIVSAGVSAVPDIPEGDQIFSLTGHLVAVLKLFLAGSWSVIFQLSLAKKDFTTLNNLTYAYAAYHTGVVFPAWQDADKMLGENK